MKKKKKKKKKTCATIKRPLDGYGCEAGTGHVLT
jgi:hypothetical protein